MAEKPRKLGNFKGVGHFEVKFYVEGLRFAPICLAVVYQLELGTRNNIITSCGHVMAQTRANGLCTTEKNQNSKSALQL